MFLFLQQLIPPYLLGSKRFFVFCFFRVVEKQFFRTYLGASWIFIRVVFIFATYAILFGIIFEGRETRIDYFDHLISGMLLWSVFISGLSWGTRSFEILRNVRKKIFLPELTIVLAGVCAGSVSFFPWVCLFVFYSVIFSNVDFHLNFYLVYSLALTGIFVLSVTLVTSVLDAFGRDSRNFISLFGSWFLFTTPVLYEVQHVPSVLRWIAQLNPLTTLLELFRHGLYGAVFDTSSIGSVMFLGILSSICFIFFGRFVLLLRETL